MESQNNDNESNQMVDLKAAQNSDTIEVLEVLAKNYGELGAIVINLVEKAKSEDKDIKIDGLGTSAITVMYGDQIASFYYRPSIDVGDGPIEHAHYAIRMYDYKKTWAREQIDKSPKSGWIEVFPITFAELCTAVSGKRFDSDLLETQYPKVKYSTILNIIAEETAILNEYFTYNPAPGLEFFKMNFINPQLREQYLNDDPKFYETFGPIVAKVTTSIHTRLAQLNAQSSAA